jgi:hypothetical protein
MCNQFHHQLEIRLDYVRGTFGLKNLNIILDGKKSIYNELFKKNKTICSFAYSRFNASA